MSEGSGNMEQRLAALFKPAVEAEGLTLWALSLTGERGRRKLRVLLDKPDGVSLGDCARISRSLSALVDVEDPIAGAYSLEVSSPGVNRPLIEPRHFAHCVGQRIKLKTIQPCRKSAKTFCGMLERYDDDPPRIVLQDEEGALTIELDNISKANVEYVFDDPVKKGDRRAKRPPKKER